MRREDLWVEALKSFGGVGLGAMLLIGGAAVFLNNGFESSSIFLLGMIMIPTGLYVLATALTGGLGVDPRTLLAVYRQERRLRALLRSGIN